MTNKNILFFCIETNRGKSILKIIDKKSNVQFELSTACLHSRLTVPFRALSQLDGASSKTCSTDFYQSFTSVCLWWSSNVLIRVVQFGGRI